MSAEGLKAMGTAEQEESIGSYFASSTNWFVTDGSLEGAINFVNSSSTAEDADLIPTAILLERPTDSPPCEITISFREKHEIHSIYVRSTARIYEIYYTSDKKTSSSEYLCTVRCSAAVPEDASDVLPRSDSNNTTEDGWVDIMLPDSLPQENGIASLSNLSGENICPRSQIHYEATAEISDSSPCMSVTLRLLSLQNKASVRIEEIYIFADLIEDNDADSPVHNIGTGPLLSMLAPGLLHFSSSGSLQFNDRSFRGATTGSKVSSSLDKTIDESFLDMPEISEVAASSMMGNSEAGIDKYHVLKLKADENIGARGCVENASDEPTLNHTQTKTVELERTSDQSRNAKSNETNDVYINLEKVLDDLVSRVGRIENFCLSFQESILKPLTGIDLRLQRMEEKLDASSKAAPLLPETDPSSRTSYPSEHSSNLENESCIPLSAKTESSSHEKAAAVDELTVSLPEALKIPGLVVKAPEFPDDDDGNDDDDDGDDDESSTNHNFVDLTRKQYLKSGMPLSIDSALASALAAFVASNTYRSSAHNSHSMDVPNEKQLSDNHFVDSADVTVRSVVEWVLEDRNFDVPYEVQDKTSQNDKCCFEMHGPDDTLKQLGHITEANTQHNCSCDEPLLYGDDSSAEIHEHETVDLIIRQSEFLFGDDIPNRSKISDSLINDYTDSHSHVLPDPGSTPLRTLFLSSERTSYSKSSLNSNDDDTVERSFDDVFIRSKLEVDSLSGAVPLTGDHIGCSEALDVISQMNSYHLKQVSFVVPGQDDLTSTIKFSADETLKSWLPLEVLLGEKSDDKVCNGEDLVSNLELYVNRNSISGLPPEALDENSEDRPLIQVKSQALIQKSEIEDNTLLDLTCNFDLYDVSGMMKTGSPSSPVCFSNGQHFSSLI